jgi:hypothetical protein
LFDGDSQNVGTSDEKHTIQANRNILGLFDINADYPDGYVHDNYLGFTRRLEDALNIGEISSNVKGLKLFIRFKQAIQEGNAVPQWVGLIAEKIDLLPEEAVSVLQNLETKNIIEDFEEIPF